MWSGYLSERLFHVKQERRQGDGGTKAHSSAFNLHIPAFILGTKGEA
jgi:hypothetical protein